MKTHIKCFKIYYTFVNLALLVTNCLCIYLIIYIILKLLIKLFMTSQFWQPGSKSAQRESQNESEPPHLDYSYKI